MHDELLSLLPKVDFTAPQGHVNISTENNHMLCNSILAEAGEDGQWKVIEHFGQIEPFIPNCSLR